MLVRYLVFGLAAIGLASPSKILLLPAPLYSHCLEASSIGHELVRRGHDVAMAFDSSFDPKNCVRNQNQENTTIRQIVFPAGPQPHTFGKFFANLQSFLRMGKKFQPFEYGDLVAELIKNMTANTFHDTDALYSLEQENFDLAVVDGFYMSYSLFTIPYKLGIPYVGLTSVFEEFVTGRPFLPSIIPCPFLAYSDEMGFLQRIHNAFLQIKFHILIKSWQPMDEIQKLVPGLARDDLIRIVSNSELFLYNTDSILGFPAPIMPNHIQIGGIATRPASPLPGHINQFYERSSQGVVVVSFGSLFGELPEQAENALIKAFKTLKLGVLWKYSKSIKAPNLVTVNWLPQNDVLGHRKTKLFISHCGNNGLFEAVYHAVPILCMPLFVDQVHNAVRVQHWDVGDKLDLMAASSDDIFRAISDILSNPRHQSNMKKASDIFHSRPFTPRERAAFWIEHVIKFGGKHLRSKASEMSTFRYMGYDLVLLVTAAICVSLVILYKTTLAVCFYICRETRKEKRN